MPYSKKPLGYWNNFDNLEQELLQFICEYGTKGVMPSPADFTKAGRGDLAGAVSKHGGYLEVASRLGLSNKQKPPGYWAELEPLEEELTAFIQEHGKPGVMPTSTSLRKLGRSDIVAAILMHGGFSKVAERLGLQFSYVRKPRNYWNDFGNIISELQAFIDQYGSPGTMPTATQLAEHGYSALANAITEHGGFHDVANKLGLGLTYDKKPPNYWDHFDRLADELYAFIDAHGTPAVMPTVEQLNRHGRGDLSPIIRRHGGVHRVAKRLGLELTYSRKPPRYWDDIGNLERELMAFVRARGNSTVMPTQEDLEEEGRHDLVNAIHKHGGTRSVAERFGLTLQYSSKPAGYWDNFDNLKQELEDFIQERGTSGVLPTQDELKNAGRFDLVSAMRKYGGVRVVAERLGLRPGTTSKPNGYWDDFINLAHELKIFMEEYGNRKTMPTTRQLAKAGRFDLANAIQRHGGIQEVAESLRLKYAKKKHRYWNDFENLRQELLEFVDKHGKSGCMPTHTEITNFGRLDLPPAIKKHGGYPAVAEKLGLKLSYDTKPSGYWDDFSNLEREILSFIRVSGIFGVMPTSEELVLARRSDLIHGITVQGGFPRVAQQLRLDLAYYAKPPNYWDNFANVEREIDEFNRQHGTVGIMPTTPQLEKVGFSGLSGAIIRHGGFASVAARLGLAQSYSKRPSGYWNDFSNIEKELQAFIQSEGLDRIMPTGNELAEANRNDLMGAIRKHGGVKVIAARLGLTLRSKKKEPGYWAKFSNLEHELRSFITEYGMPEVLPSNSQLQQAGRSDLVNAIRRHGGLREVAKRLSLRPSSRSKPAAYWDDVTNFDRELLAFIERHGALGRMPTDDEFEARGRGDLIHAMKKHGGRPVVSHRLGLTAASTSKPPGYWDNFDHLRDELLAFIDAHGQPGVMPMHREFSKAGRGDLPSAIRKHGGIHSVAQRLGLQVAAHTKPPRYWDDFSNVGKAVIAFNKERQMPGVMPTVDELVQAGRSDLVGAIARHGGSQSVAERLGLQYSRKRPGYWRDFDHVEVELRTFLNRRGTPGVMPTTNELAKAGLSSLASAIGLHGGTDAVARRLGLRMSYDAKPAYYWSGFETVEKELLSFIETHGTEGVMPSFSDLERAGRYDIKNAIARHGGIREVAKRLSLTLSTTRKPAGYWDDFETVEREIRAFSESQGGSEMMPTRDMLCKAGRSDLANAIARHGGVRAVAIRLGLATSSKSG